MNDTIFALSSGAAPAAIAVVRISGPGADAALEALTGTLPEPRRAALATVRHDGETLDRAILLRFPGPESATGEDVAEIHLHGGRAVVAAVLTVLGTFEGLRPAEPGEFTRRAFEKGRIDLAEAEGLADLLEAETEAQRRAALALAGGVLSRQIQAWQDRLLATAARVEAALDFDDEDDVHHFDASLIAPEIAALADEIETWLARPSAERLREGIKVVIAGPPNSGKSSLLNALAGRDAAITSSIPGTTRDVIEAPVAIEGVPFVLIDTAGLRRSTDDIEVMGIDRARRQVDAADIVLWLGAPGERPDGALAIHSKCDLLGPGSDADISLSAVTGEGLGTLTRTLIRNSAQLLPQNGELALNRRHREVLQLALEALREGRAAPDMLIVAESVRRARIMLDRVTGRGGVEDMLDALFARFCIGK